MVWAFIIAVVLMNLIFLLMLAEIRQEVIDYILRRDNDDALD